MTNLGQSQSGTALHTERRIPVLALSHGTAIGKAVFWIANDGQPRRRDIDRSEINAEVQRLRAASLKTIEEISTLAEANRITPAKPVSGILDVHLSIIEQSSFISKVEAVIESQRVNAEWALFTIAREYAERQAAVSDETFSEKSLDIEDVADRLLKSLGGSRAANGAYTDAVVIARDLRPTNVLDLVQCRPAAIVTLRAGWTSHTSIIAREFKIPMVSGAEEILETVAEGDRLIVDAVGGEVIIDPSHGTLAAFEAKAASELPGDISVSPARKQTTTVDGCSVLIRANADSPKAYEQAFEMGARGVGLYRSESLIRESGVQPSEDDQLAGYVAIADAAGADGIKVRTLDIESGDYGSSSGFSERNPALGLRSIRLSLAEVDHFRSQIRAILRASCGRHIDIVLPMVSGAGEIEEARKWIDAEQKALAAEGSQAGTPGVGAMIEVPSAVLTVRDILKNVDFLCLGTNDLVQYLLAVDRDNHAVADWYQTLHPAVIRAVGDVLTAAAEASKPVTVCGEMAGSPFYVPLLLGLGARELSMNVNSIQRVQRLICGISLQDCVHLAQSAKDLHAAKDIEDLLREYYREHWSELFPSGFLEARYR